MEEKETQLSLYSTYEELKRGWWNEGRNNFTGFYSTYEELKL